MMSATRGSQMRGLFVGLSVYPVAVPRRSGKRYARVGLLVYSWRHCALQFEVEARSGAYWIVMICRRCMLLVWCCR